MTRVLFLAESFHPVLGGGETHVLRLGSALVAAGDAATVVTRRGEPSWPAEEVVNGIRVVRVPPSGPGRTGKFLMVPAAFRAVLREARGHDLLVVRGTRVLGLPGLVAARATRLGVVMQPETNGELSGEAWTWGKDWAGGPAGRLARGLFAVRNRLLRDADAFVAMSRAIREEMLAAGVPGERIALLPHGVDTERFRPADPAERAALRARLGLPDGVLAAWSGRLLRGKGLETLLDAFARAAGDVPDLRLVLVGSGEGQALSVEDELRRRAAARPASRTRVVFTGRVERVEDVLRAADLFVFPSVFEALGISLVEAAACGLCRRGQPHRRHRRRRRGRPLGAPRGAGRRGGARRGPARPRHGPGSPRRDGAGGAEGRPGALRRARRVRPLPGPLPGGHSSSASSSRPGRAPRAGGGPPPSPAARA